MRKITKVTAEELNALGREILTPEDFANLASSIQELAEALRGSEMELLLAYLVIFATQKEVCCLGIVLGYLLAQRRAENRPEGLVN